jgi:tRNA pseudouridine13 synthase
VARLRDTPEDFRVDEIPLYPAAGHGDHTFVRVSKRLRTTEQVARDLARAAGVPPRDVGYAGRKDRRAVATQWLSVPGLAPERALELALPGATVLEAVRHPHKLRTGQLRGNRFELLVRDVDGGQWAEAEGRLEEIQTRGFENRFGAQRFGSEGDNALRAVQVLERGAPRGKRREARFLVSALQARAFNAALDARALPVHTLEVGDLAVRHDSGGMFVVEDLQRESARAEAYEISPTGPIFGTRMPRAGGTVDARELEVLLGCGIDLFGLRAPPGISLRGGRRPLRVRPESLEHRLEGGVLRLCFTLPAGSYATVFVDALLLEPVDFASNDLGRSPLYPDAAVDGGPG